MRTFLAPDGPFRVGMVLRELEDGARPRHLAVDAPGRRLLVQLWYPAVPPADARPVAVWQALREPGRAPWLVRGLLGLLRYRGTAVAGARLAGAALRGVVLYNHGLVSFAGENGSLVEELASHGFVVIAVEHREQRAEWLALERSQPPAQRRAARELQMQIIRADAAARGALARRYYEACANTNAVARERAVDAAWVLERLASLLAAIPGRDPAAGLASPVLAVGFSLGGAVASTFASCDTRVAGVVNLDGGLHGLLDARAIRVPMLMAYSAGNAGLNDSLLPTQAQRVVAPETTHLNFHDAAGLVPALRWLRATGRADALGTLRWRNRLVAAFCRTL